MLGLSRHAAADRQPPKVCNRKPKPQRRLRRPSNPSTRKPGVFLFVATEPSRSVFVVTFFVHSSNGSSANLSSGLALGLGNLITAGLDAGQDVLAVLVQLELGDNDVAGVDAEGNALTAGLVAGDTLNMDDVFEAVDRGDLALLVLVEAANDLDLVVLADGDAPDLCETPSVLINSHEDTTKGSGTYVVLLTELLAEGSAHDVAADARRRAEVGLARLAPRGGNVCKRFVNFPRSRELAE